MINILMNEDGESNIIEFIRANPGCMPEECFRGIKEHMGRQKFFNLLTSLKQDNVIQVSLRNRRDQSLYLNGEDPLIIVVNAFDKFQYTYFQFFDKVLQEIKKPHSSIRMRVDAISKKENRIVLPADHHELFNTAIFVFQRTLTRYILEILLKWSTIINDKQQISKIFEYSLRRTSKLYSKLFEKIERIDVHKDLKIRLNPKAKNLSDLVINDIMNLGYDMDQVDENMFETFEFFSLIPEWSIIPDSLQPRGIKDLEEST